MEDSVTQFLYDLASDKPAPGGGGVAALAGSLSCALCSMVASLTSGKKKYAMYQEDIERLIKQAQSYMLEFKELVDEDARSFLPLAKAYGMDKNDPNRKDILESALKVAANAPLDVIRKAEAIVPMLEELLVKGSRLAISDCGVAATLCKSMVQSCVLNVYINTKLMTDREYALNMNEETDKLSSAICSSCDKIYEGVLNNLV